MKKRPVDIYDDDEDDALANRRALETPARLAAAVRGITFNSYLNSTTPSFPVVDANIKPGDTYIPMDILANKDKRESAPRADGVDPAHPSERRYGPSWRSEYDRRHQMMQENPYYLILTLIAGHANQDLLRLFNVESMESRRTGERARQRIADLRAKIAEANIEDQQKRLAELRRVEDEQQQGLGRLKVLEKTEAERAKLNAKSQSVVARANSAQKLVKKYDHLWQIQQSLEKALQQVGAGDDNDKFKAWADQLERMPESFNLFRDFLFGVELSSVEGTQFSLANYVDFLRDQNDPMTGGKYIPSSRREQMGERIGTFLQEWMHETQERDDLIDDPAFISRRQTLPQFSEKEIANLLYPHNLKLTIRELRQKASEIILDARQIEKEQKIREQIEALQADYTKEVSLDYPIPTSLFNRLNDILDVLGKYGRFAVRNQDIGYVREQLLGPTGDRIPKLLDTSHIREVGLQSELEDINRTVKIMDQQIAEIDERSQTIKTLEARIERARQDVSRALEEINDLDKNTYKDSFAHQNQPWISGILDLTPRVAATLSQAHEKVKKRMRTPDLELHELMTAERWRAGFSILVGRLLQRNGMASGSSYTQADMLNSKDEEIELIMREYFAPKSGFQLFDQQLASARRDRAEVVTAMSPATREMIPGADLEIDDFAQRQILGYNSYSALNPNVPIALNAPRRPDTRLAPRRRF